MSLNDASYREARQLAGEQFFTAASGKPPTDEQKEALKVLHGNVLDLATSIYMLIPYNRDRSLALTALEDVLMRANRGVFAR